MTDITGKIIDNLNSALTDLDKMLIIERHSDEVLQQVLQSNEIDSLLKSKIALHLDDSNHLLDILRILNTEILEYHLFDSDNAEREMVLLEQIVQILERISEENEELPDFYFDKGSSSFPSKLLFSELFNKIRSNLSFQNAELRENQIRILTTLIRGVGERKYIKSTIDNLYFASGKLFQILQTQLPLLYSPFLKVNGKGGVDAFNLLKSSNINRYRIELIELDQIPFSILKDILKYDIVPDGRRLVINEISEPEILGELIIEDVFGSEIDLAMNKLDDNTIIELIQNHNQERIVHYIKDRNFLRTLFYEIDKHLTKAIIAIKLGDADLSFEILEILFQIDNRLPKSILEKLIVEVTQKQLMILRLTAPSEYQQLILNMVEVRNQREKSDNEMFL